MRKTVIILVDIILLSVMLFVYVYAHSGRTDGAGGHYDRSSGEYHYHHGYPAHSHTIEGCPYEYDDKTHHSSNNSYSTNFNSNINTSSAPDNPSNSNDTLTKQQTAKTERPVWKNVVGIGFGVLICSPLILFFLFYLYYGVILPVVEYIKRIFKR